MPVTVKGEDLEAAKKPFGPEFQADLIRYLIDLPHQAVGLMKYLKRDYFDYPYDIAFLHINTFFETGGNVPSRSHLIEKMGEELTADDDPAIIEAIKKELSPRNEAYITNGVMNFCRHQAYNRFYSEPAFQALQDKNYKILDEIAAEARVAGTSADGNGGNFFDTADKLFEPDKDVHYTTGIPLIDDCVNSGGPKKQEVFGFLGATGGGKSIALTNVGVANCIRGANVLHISLEMGKEAIDQRYSTAFSRIPSVLLKSKSHTLLGRVRREMSDRLAAVRAQPNFGRLFTYSLSPNVTTITEIQALIGLIEAKERCKIDVLVLDYLEKLGSAVKEKNKREEYQRQACVAVELYELTKSMNICTFTATQTNREGYVEAGKNLHLGHAAGSYDKTTPMDYWVSLIRNDAVWQQGLGLLNAYKLKMARLTETQRATQPISELESRVWVWNNWRIIKNRNGPEAHSALVAVNYLTCEIGWWDDGHILVRDGRVANPEMCARPEARKAKEESVDERQKAE